MAANELKSAAAEFMSEGGTSLGIFEMVGDPYTPMTREETRAVVEVMRRMAANLLVQKVPMGKVLTLIEKAEELEEVLNVEA